MANNGNLTLGQKLQLTIPANDRNITYSVNDGKGKPLTYTLLMTKEAAYITFTAYYNATKREKGIQKGERMAIMALTLNHDLGQIETRPKENLTLANPIDVKLEKLGMTRLTSHLDVVSWLAFPTWLDNAEKLVRQHWQSPILMVLAELFYQIEPEVKENAPLEDAPVIRPFTAINWWIAIIKSHLKAKENPVFIAQLAHIPSEYQFLIEEVTEQQKQIVSTQSVTALLDATETIIPDDAPLTTQEEEIIEYAFEHQEEYKGINFAALQHEASDRTKLQVILAYRMVHIEGKNPPPNWRSKLYSFTVFEKEDFSRNDSTTVVTPVTEESVTSESTELENEENSQELEDEETNEDEQEAERIKLEAEEVRIKAEAEKALADARKARPAKPPKASV